MRRLEESSCCGSRAVLKNKHLFCSWVSFTGAGWADQARNRDSFSLHFIGRWSCSEVAEVLNGLHYLFALQNRKTIDYLFLPSLLQRT